MAESRKDRVTITRRVALGYVVVLILTVLLVGGGVWASVWVNMGEADVTDSVERVDAANRIDLAVSDLGSYAASSIISEAALKYDELVSRLRTDVATAQQGIDDASALEAHGAAHTEQIAGIQAGLESYQAAVTSVIELAITDAGQALNKLNGDPQTTLQNLQAMASAYKDDEIAQQKAALDSLKSTSTSLLIIMIAIGSVAIVLGVLAAIFVNRIIRRQLNRAVGGITTSAAQLQAISSQVAAGAAQTASSTNETTATVEEVKQTAQLANEKATEVAASSENVARVAESGRATVEETVAGIERMQAQMSAVAETINSLSEQTQAVGDIIATVNDIAEQSNLLSVNASIEAAKAGEQGKGFTVVAQEVKSLAEQSKQAVARVRTILDEIQKATTRAVSAAEEGREAIEAGRRQSLESGEAIHSLAENANEAAESALQISASSRQQLAGMEQISQAIESINQASTQSVSGTRQVEQEVKQLQDLAFDLKRLVDAKANA